MALPGSAEYRVKQSHDTDESDQTHLSTSPLPPSREFMYSSPMLVKPSRKGQATAATALNSTLPTARA